MTEYQYKLLRVYYLFIFFLFIVSILTFISGYVENKKKDEALKWWVGEHYKMDIPDGYARHLNGIITTTDVQLSIEQFSVFEGNY